MSSSEWTIYYNPKCGTCRKTLELLRSRNIEPHIVEYLKTPLRAKEDEYAANGLSEASTRRQIAAAIAKDPILLQRPIVVRGRRGVVARPPEEAEALF